MLAPTLRPAWFAVVLSLALAGTASAAARVELELVGESQLSTDFHGWLRALSQAGVENVRIRSGDSVTLGIQTQGTPDRPVYVVTGLLNAHGELVLPGARFRRSEGAAIARWLADLAANGPPERREARGAFGLTARQLESVLREMSQPVTVSTQGKPRGQVVAQIAGQLPTRVTLSTAGDALGDDPVAVELSGLSCGTVLAYLVRPDGLALVPRLTGDQASCAIVPADQATEAWPIGWPPEKPARELLPILFEFLNVEIRGVTADRAIDAIGQRLKAPLLVDHAALAHHGVEPAKVTVSLPTGRSTYSLILQKVLFQARLRSELRQDEAGKPFLWITTIKPLGTKK